MGFLDPNKWYAFCTVCLLAELAEAGEESVEILRRHAAAVPPHAEKHFLGDYSKLKQGLGKVILDLYPEMKLGILAKR